MTSGPLFGSNVTRGTTKNLVEFKAGKMTVKGKIVYPDNRKGQLYVYQSDDSLMHFCWKDRTTGVVEDDLIIFPDDCEFKHVSQCKTGRVYLLKFKSSTRKFFFWLQDIKTDKDEENCRKINEVLNNPPTPGSQRSNNVNPEGDIQNLLNNMSQQQLMQLFGGVGQIGGLGSLLGTINRPYNNSRSSTASSTTQVATSNNTRSPVAPARTATASDTLKSTESSANSQSSNALEPVIGIDSSKIQLSDLQDFLSKIPSMPDTEQSVQRGVVNELSAAIPVSIITNENLENAMNVYLPTGDNLSTTLSSPQFSQALSMFWSAIQSGQAAPVIKQFGLGSKVINAAASGNIHDFVNALESEVKKTSSCEEITKELSCENDQNGKPKQGKKFSDKDDDDEGMALD